MGVPELPQPTSSKSLGLAGAGAEDGQAVETGHEGLGAPVDSGRGEWDTGLNPWGWISRPTRAPLQAHRAQLSGTAAGGN